MTTELAKLLLKTKSFSSTGFYFFWPYFLWRSAERKKYVEVEGHEFETPDRYSEQIKKTGYGEWLRQFDNINEWKRRFAMVEDMLMEFLGHGILRHELDPKFNQ